MARGRVPMEWNLRRDAHASSVVSLVHEAFESTTHVDERIGPSFRASILAAARLETRARGRSSEETLETSPAVMSRNRATRASPDDGDDDALARDLFRSIRDAVRATNAREEDARGMGAGWA